MKLKSKMLKLIFGFKIDEDDHDHNHDWVRLRQAVIVYHMIIIS